METLRSYLVWTEFFVPLRRVFDLHGTAEHFLRYFKANFIMLLVQHKACLIIVSTSIKKKYPLLKIYFPNPSLSYQLKNA